MTGAKYVKFECFLSSSSLVRSPIHEVGILIQKLQFLCAIRVYFIFMSSLFQWKCIKQIFPTLCIYNFLEKKSAKKAAREMFAKPTP